MITGFKTKVKDNSEIIYWGKVLSAGNLGDSASVKRAEYIIIQFAFILSKRVSDT